MSPVQSRIVRWSSAIVAAALLSTAGCGRPDSADETESRDGRHFAPKNWTQKKHDRIYDDYAAAKMRLRTSWTEDLRAAHAHGGEGVVPPMLDVIDSGQGVQVTNIGNVPLCLDLRRSLHKLGPGYEYQCALWSDRGGLHSCVEYPPGHQEWLRMSSARPDLPDCSGEPLEFRVGEWEKTGLGWWSDAALIDYDSQTGRLDTDNLLYATLIAAPDNIWKDDFVREVTRIMEAMPVGPPRVAQWRDQIAGVIASRPAQPVIAPAERAARAAQLNLVREIEAQIRAMKSLRERQTHVRRSDKDKVFPDYLPVEDHLDRVTVTHPLGAVFYVNLARVGNDPRTGQEFVCEMRGLGRGNSAGTYVSATVPGNFVASSHTGPCANLEGTRLEMVVNNFDGDLTFATPSALDRMQAKAEARLQELQSNAEAVAER